MTQTNSTKPRQNAPIQAERFFFRTLFSASGNILLLAVLLLGLLAWQGSKERIAPSDVAVVFGTTAYPDGTLHPRLEARVMRALELWRAGTVRHILVSGGTDQYGTDEARNMKAFLESQGVPAEAITVHSEGVNTLATALYTAHQVASGRWQSVMVVSEFYHVPRCRLAMHMAGVKNLRWARADYFERGDILRLVRELAAIVRYLFHDYSLKHEPGGDATTPAQISLAR